MRNTLPPLASNEYCYGLGHARTFRGVDLLHDRIILPQTKNGDARIVYLNKFAQSALAALPSDENTKPIDRIFVGVTRERVSVAFRRTCRALGIADFAFTIYAHSRIMAPNEWRGHSHSRSTTRTQRPAHGLSLPAP